MLVRKDARHRQRNTTPLRARRGTRHDQLSPPQVAACGSRWDRVDIRASAQPSERSVVLIRGIIRDLPGVPRVIRGSLGASGVAI
jgi:hypothetical protein